MRLRFFTIPLHGGDESADDLNRFLAGHRILSIDRHFAQDGANSAWAVCVAYEATGEGRPAPPGDRNKRDKVDYREVLDEADFAVYAKLRSLRKTLADAEGVPAYALFTNEQMAAMVQNRVATATALRGIPRIGAARVEKYAGPFLALLRESFEAPPPDGAA